MLLTPGVFGCWVREWQWSGHQQMADSSQINIRGLVLWKNSKDVQMGEGGFDSCIVWVQAEIGRHTHKAFLTVARTPHL